MPQTDSQLIEKIRAGNTRAFDELYDRYKSEVYRFGFFLARNGDEADELFQEVWLRVVKAIPKAGDIRDFKAWVITITVNLHRDRIRKKRRRRLLFTSTPVHDLKEKETAVVADTTDSIGIASEIHRAIHLLPDSQRRIFVLKEVEGYKLKEIAAMLQIPLGTVKSQHHRALKILRGELKRLYEESHEVH